MKQEFDAGPAKGARLLGGVAGWLLKRLRVAPRAEPRLVVLERIVLVPRQSLALVRADGRRFLVATSPEGTPAFFCLDDVARRPESASIVPVLRRPARRRDRPGADRDARAQRARVSDARASC
jgi:hypothetical protein